MQSFDTLKMEKIYRKYLKRQYQFRPVPLTPRQRVAAMFGIFYNKRMSVVSLGLPAHGKRWYRSQLEGIQYQSKIMRHNESL
ncbi:MAG: hypothetical protein BGO59_25710 [Spirosoma sp. 48-14]|nr:MAG: hypothetical protein BGO59_25710 [Spirosoma sp. 48-14]